MLADALEHLVRGIVDNPDDVQVNAKAGFTPRTSAG